MKTIKSILIAATLIGASLVSTLSAEEAKPAQERQWKVAIGDSVMIKRECQKYLTGETPSKWVWDKVHTVRQLGTKRFPDGVLLMNIYSWMCEDCLIPVNERAKEASEEAAKEQAAEREAFEKARQEKLKAEAAKAEESKAEPVVAEQPKEEPKVEEPKEEPKAEPVVAEQPAEEKPAEEPVAAPEEEKQKTEQAKGDSIHSKQDFGKGGYDRFTIGVRGGVSGLMHQVTKGSWNPGFDAILDLQYAHYWTKMGRPVDLGIIVGVGIGYAQSGMKAAVDTAFKYTDKSDPSFPLDVDYKIHADEVRERDGQIQLEVPVLFSLIHEKGLFFNVGPKFMIPVYTPYKQSIAEKNTEITAYFEQLGVPVTNAVITGMLKEDQYKLNGSDNGNQFTINVLLTAEIGYEWILKSGNSLGLGAYANYGWNLSFKNDKTTNKPLIEVIPPTTGVADVNVYSATKMYTNKLGYFDAGVKLAYHFNFPKKRKFADSKLF